MVDHAAHPYNRVALCVGPVGLLLVGPGVRVARWAEHGAADFDLTGWLYGRFAAHDFCSQTLGQCAGLPIVLGTVSNVAFPQCGQRSGGNSFVATPPALLPPICGTEVSTGSPPASQGLTGELHHAHQRNDCSAIPSSYPPPGGLVHSSVSVRPPEQEQERIFVRHAVRDVP
jgi:hypothetical protein